MIVVLHFCSKDWEATARNLNWMLELDPHSSLPCLLAYDDETPPAAVQRIEALARRYFASIKTFWYPAPLKKTWPAAPNWAWQNVARYIEWELKQPWLWLESDAIPIRTGWLTDIESEYSRCGQPFMGVIPEGMNHLNGVCVYPGNISHHTVNALMTEETAWDVVLGLDTEGKRHSADRLFQHFWAVNPATNQHWNGSGALVSFKSQADLVRWCDLKAALFHRCKDGSLIEQLRIFRRDPSAAMVPNHNEGRESKDSANRRESADVSQQKSSAESEVGELQRGIGVLDIRTVQVQEDKGQEAHKPMVAKGGIGHDSGRPGQSEAVLPSSSDQSTGGILGGDGKGGATGAIETSEGTVLSAQDTSGVPGPTEILIVTYRKDFPWISWCLRAIHRHLTGFTGVTIVVPDGDLQLLAALMKTESGPVRLRHRSYIEEPGKGMLHHMVAMAKANEFVPNKTQFVMHLDADCIFHTPTTPADYFKDGKPILVCRTWESLADATGKVVSDCMQWRAPTEAQLGLKCPMYTMCRHPSLFPIEFYHKYRQHIAAVHGNYQNYMLSGRNEFPQDRMDFTAMGAYAWHAMHDQFSWQDISHSTDYPKDRLKVYWSHGGITPEIEQELRGFVG